MSRGCLLCPDWDAMRTLSRSIVTPIGLYPEGTVVFLLDVDGQRARICLDHHGHHLSGRCHSATVRLGWLDPVDSARRPAKTSKVGSTG